MSCQAIPRALYRQLALFNRHCREIPTVSQKGLRVEVTDALSPFSAACGVEKTGFLRAAITKGCLLEQSIQSELLSGKGGGGAGVGVQMEEQKYRSMVSPYYKSMLSLSTTHYHVIPVKTHQVYTIYLPTAQSQVINDLLSVYVQSRPLYFEGPVEYIVPGTKCATTGRG